MKIRSKMVENKKLKIIESKVENLAENKVK
jgi:hypothetical protein